MAVAATHIGVSPREARLAGSVRWLAWAVLAIVLAATLVRVGSAFIAGRLRGFLERRVNASLTGYTASIGEAELHLGGFAVELRDVAVVQNAQPKPPVLYIERWVTSLHWRALLRGRIVGDVTFAKPAVYLTFGQAQQESADPTPVTGHGWQHAVEAVYPVKINALRIRDASLTYFDTGDLPPVRMRRLDVRAENIRNVESVPGAYPSPIDVDGAMADGARVTFTGRADFLAEPHATVRGEFTLRDATLAPYTPALRHAGVAISDGRLDALGRMEYTTTQLTVALDDATLTGLHADYVEDSAKQQAALGQAAKATTTAEAAPPLRVDVVRATITNGNLGLVQRTTDPPYRVYFDRVQAEVHGFSNEKDARRGSATFEGRPMGSGALHVNAGFAPAAAKPDFTASVQLEKLDLPRLNDLLRARAGFDVASGQLSVYSEVTVRNGRIDGYVKPLFDDVSVYNRQQDKEKSLPQQAYEAAVGAGATVLQNPFSGDVATRTDISGPVDDPKSSTLQILLGLVRNAYIKSIKPGLDRGNGEGKGAESVAPIVH